MPPRADIANWDELALERVTEMVSRRTVAGDELTLTQVYLKRGALVPRHTHGREQMVYVMEGAIRFVVAEAEAEDVTVREGEVLRIPAGQAHQGEALDDALVIVVVGI